MTETGQTSSLFKTMTFQFSRKFNKQRKSNKPNSRKIDLFLNDFEKDTEMSFLDGTIGTEQKIKIVEKEVGKGFDFNQPFQSILSQTTDLQVQDLKPDWFDPERIRDLEPRPLKFRRIIDASGDGSLAEVFENGALKVNIDPSDYANYRRLNVGREGVVSSFRIPVNVSVSAKDLETGDIIDLGTQRLDPNKPSIYVDLKDKINAVSTGSMRDQYAISVTSFTGREDRRNVIDSFQETITVIKPMQYGSNHLGDETSNDFNYRDIGSAFGSARIFQGRGGTDTLHLDGIASSDVSFFNGNGRINAATASDLGDQSFYGGTVFDSLGLKNGDELYLQGIERLAFEDVTIDLTPNLDTRSDNQWNTQVMDVNGAWRFNTGSEDVVLVSLDNGFDGNASGDPDIHTDLNHVWFRSGVNSATRQEDHGHKAMSVMAAAHDSSEVAGVAPDATLWGYNVYRGGDELQDAISDAIASRRPGQKLVFQGGVQGESWWTNGGTRAEMNNLFATSNDFGFFSIAAGNGGEVMNDGSLRYPNYMDTVSGIATASTSYDNVASVGALRVTSWEFESGHRNAGGTVLADYSNRGNNLTLVAPTNSDSIINSGGGVTSFGGTSCANPNLAGVAALVWSENSNLDGGELREILISSAMDLEAGGFDNTTGNGLVNAEGATRRAHALDQNAELASFWTNAEFLA